MTVTLTYDASLSRIRVNATGLGAATTAKVERSTNQVTWTTVRGATVAPVVSGALVTVDDYEFVDQTINYYRVTYSDAAAFIAAGTAAHADNASVVPTIPAGSIAGDLMLILAATRTLTVTPVAPVGYITMYNAGNVKLFAKIHTGSESNPTVAFNGVSHAGMSVSAQMATLRNAKIGFINGAVSFNSSAQNIVWPTLVTSIGPALVLIAGWKQDDFTSVVNDIGTEIGEFSTTLGDDQGLVWAYAAKSTPQTITSGVFTVIGGGSAISTGFAISIASTSTTQSASVTPSLDGTWLKSLGRPFLNRRLDCVSNPTIERGARGSVTPVAGSTLPVGVDEVRGAREVEIDVSFGTPTDRTDFNVIIGTGDPLFFHAPSGDPLPTMYAVVATSNEERPVLNRRCLDEDWRRFRLPLKEVAAPASSIAGATGTWQTVVDTYASWNSVLAAKTTWLKLAELVGSISEVVVG